jgi:hypothetical protein
MDLFFQFSSFCTFKQKPEWLGVEGGGGGGVETWRAWLGPALPLRKRFWFLFIYLFIVETGLQDSFSNRGHISSPLE